MKEKRLDGAIPRRQGRARKIVTRVTVLGLLVLGACAMQAPGGGTVEVDGFDVRVTPVRGMPGVFRAEHRRAARQDGAYYARQVIAIRQVSGCRVDARKISHAGAVSEAGVLCG